MGVIAAAVLCVWIIVVQFTADPAVIGCGGVACHGLLEGRWSKWFGVPVSFLALGFYAVVLALTTDAVQRYMGRQADRLLCACCMMVIVSALWFLGIMLLGRQFCVYCAAMHVLAAAGSIPVLVRAWKLRLAATTGFFSAAISTCLAGIFILLAGQLLGPLPPTYVISELKMDGSRPVVQARLGEVSFMGGGLVYRVHELPIIGNQDATHVLVDYFDYTCEACRRMHEDLQAMRRKFGQKFAVILIPSPLDGRCNPHTPSAREDQGACELARLALAVWRKSPEKFPDFHQYLLQLPLPANVKEARTHAATLVDGDAALAIALEDSWIAERMKATFEEYALLTTANKKMPKLLLRANRVMNGQARDTQSFLEILETEFPGP